ncbi:MAG: tyrosine-type recombinase/integrase [bacterium]
MSTYLRDWLTLKSPDLKPRTIDSYDQLIRRISAEVGELDISELSNNDVRHLLAVIVAEGHNRTAEAVFVLLRCALKDVNPQIMAKVKRPKNHQKHPVPWKEEYVVRYIAACQSHKHGLALQLALTCGLRRGEICGLRWKDVDLVNMELHIVNQRVTLSNGQTIDCAPKSACSIRDVPIPIVLLPTLKRALGHPEAYVTPLTPSGLSQAHAALVANLGLPHIGLHGLRHTFATSSVKAGGDIRSLQEIMGHSSYSVTMDIYTHPDHDMKSRTVDKATTSWYNVLH